MLSILAIFAWWYQGKVVTVHRENYDLLPLNFGRDFQLNEAVPDIHHATNHEQLLSRYNPSGRRGQGIVQRVPIPRLNRMRPNRHRSCQSCSQSWIPGLPVHNQYLGAIIQELHQIQQDEYTYSIANQNQHIQDH